MKIGVFDSGLGGMAMAERLAELLPGADIMTINDHSHVPYGSKPPEEIVRLTMAAITPLVGAGYDAIVIACNTATTIALSTLRATYPNEKFIGIEPMVKPACSITASNKIAVLATPATLASQRYHDLKAQYAADVAIAEPDCTEWASLIEDGQEDQIPLRETLDLLVNEGVDVIVLACTHYAIIAPQLDALYGDRVTILEPSDAIALRIEFLTKLAG